MSTTFELDDPVATESLETTYYLFTGPGAAAVNQSREYGVDPQTQLFEPAAILGEDPSARSFLLHLSS